MDRHRAADGDHAGAGPLRRLPSYGRPFVQPLRATCLVWIGAALILCDGEVYSAERTALTLAGAGCSPSRQAIIQALEQFDGVARVEADLIPDHLLIDHRDGTVTGDALAAVIDSLRETGGECHAVVMRSCITAGTEARQAVTPPSR